MDRLATTPATGTVRPTRRGTSAVDRFTNPFRIPQAKQYCPMRRRRRTRGGRTLMGDDQIDILNRLDDEHLRALRLIPDGLHDFADLAESLIRIKAHSATTTKPRIDSSVSITDHFVNGFESHSLLVRMYTPDGARAVSPGVFWIHGGGFVLGDVSASDPWCAEMARKLNVVVASVEYRLAPKFPYPIPLEDCYAGFERFFGQASELGVSTDLIAVAGSSAGAGLAAGLAMLARDREQITPCFQLLTHPMLDDRCDTPSSYLITDTRMWNRAANRVAWDAYLDGNAGSDTVPVYAAPARATDLSLLPPAIITVGDLDLFVDEDVAFAQALRRAGVPTELHVYPGAVHGPKNFAPESDVARRWKHDELAALDRILNS